MHGWTELCINVFGSIRVAQFKSDRNTADICLSNKLCLNTRIVVYNAVRGPICERIIKIYLTSSSEIDSDALIIIRGICRGKKKRPPGVVPIRSKAKNTWITEII